jgi:hypothetical protein
MGFARRVERSLLAGLWLRVANDLKLLGVQGILIAVVGGPKGFPRGGDGHSQDHLQDEFH